MYLRLFQEYEASNNHLKALKKEKQISTPAGKMHEASAEEEPFDSRKLQYLRPADGKEPRSQTSVSSHSAFWSIY